MKRFHIALFLICFGLTACGSEVAQIATPREPGPNSIGHYCRMTLAEHKGPKGQILLRGWKEPLWFSSVRDSLTYMEQDLVSDREIAGFWVNDMGQGNWDQPAPGSWVEARTALFVIGSSRASGMGGSEAVPFKERAAAQAFAKEHGGRIVEYMEARRSVTSSPPEGENSQAEGRT